MGMGDGRQGTQPEFTPRLMMPAVQGQAVAKGDSRSMLILGCPVRWKKEQEEEGEAKEEKQGGQGGQT